MSLHDAFQLIAKQVNETCKTNLNADTATALLGQIENSIVSGTYNREPARDVIEELLLQQRLLLYYSVDYVPGLNVYYLATWIVRETITGADGNQVRRPVINKKFVDTVEHPF